MQVGKVNLKPIYAPGYGTEYSENYLWEESTKYKSINKDVDVLKHSHNDLKKEDVSTNCDHSNLLVGECTQGERNIAAFKSDLYPCIYRDVKLSKDDREKYIHPCTDVMTNNYGRRLKYDRTHPDMIYPSQYSSELADFPGPYSFPSPLGVKPEMPWTKDLQWQVESEVGAWPTDLWKKWTQVAQCPCYDGHDDQVQYSKYKFS